MLRFKKYLIESVEKQLRAIKDFEEEMKRLKQSGPVMLSDPGDILVAGAIKPGFEANFYKDKMKVFFEPSVGNWTNIGFYSPGQNTTLISASNPSSELELLRHEIGGHGYQDLRQREQGKKTDSETKIKSRSPNISNASRDGGNTNPNYVLDDAEINARAIANARKAQDWYENALKHGMGYVDQNDKKAVQDLKNKMRSFAMELGLKDELTRWGKENFVFNPKDTSKVEKLSDKATETLREKIARGLAQVENEMDLPSQAIGGIKTNTNQNNVSTTPRSTNTVNRQGMPSSSSVSGSPNINLATDMAINMMGLLTTPEPKTRMQGEKLVNSDFGLAFDYVDGELVMSPEGFEAVRRRQKEGYSLPTYYPRDLYK